MGLYCGAIVKSMICGESGNAPGCVCSGCGGIGGSASGAREKNHHTHCQDIVHLVRPMA